jgi:hypothetical protein
MAYEWVYKIADDDSGDYDEPHKGEKLVRVVREDAKVVLTEQLREQLRKEVEELTLEERHALAKALSRPRHLTKSERPEDKLALALATEKDEGGRSLLLVGDDEKLVGNGKVTRLDLSKSAEPECDGTAPPLGERPSVTRLTVKPRRRR